MWRRQPRWQSLEEKTKLVLCTGKKPDNFWWNPTKPTCPKFDSILAVLGGEKSAELAGPNFDSVLTVLVGFDQFSTKSAKFGGCQFFLGCPTFVYNLHKTWQKTWQEGYVRHQLAVQLSGATAVLRIMRLEIFPILTLLLIYYNYINEIKSIRCEYKLSSSIF
jgi:hypothetical protein